MIIEKIEIKNFRTFKDISIDCRDMTIIIGENNVGKTNVLKAIEKVFGVNRERFIESDFHIVSDDFDARNTDPIEITITFIGDRNNTEGEVQNNGESEVLGEAQEGSHACENATFSEAEDALFLEHYSIDPDTDNKSLILRAKHWYSSDDEDFYTDIRFIRRDNIEGAILNQRLRKQLVFFLIEAERNVYKEIGGRSGLLSRLLGRTELTGTTRESISTLADCISQVVNKDEYLSNLTKEFSKVVKDIIPVATEDNSIVLSPLPINSSDIVRGANINIKFQGQSQMLPIYSHGTGSQSAIILSVFEAFAKMSGVLCPVYGIEEPEAHLHPQAQRYVYRHLERLQGQVLVTSHSSFIVDQADPFSIRLLRRNPDGIVEVKTIPEIDAYGNEYLSLREHEKLKRILTGKNSEVYFSRAVILVEGPSEKTAYPLFASAMGYDFDKIGVSVVDSGGDDFSILIKVLGNHAFDIPYVVQTDGEITTIIKSVKLLTKLGVIREADWHPIKDDAEQLCNSFLAPNNIYPLYIDNTEYDFESYIMNTPTGLSSYEIAIRELEYEDRLVKFLRIHDDELKDSTRSEQLHAFIKKECSKPTLAAIAVKELMKNDDIDLIPEGFKKTIEVVVSMIG